MSAPTLSPVRNPRSSAVAQGEGLAAGRSVVAGHDPHAGDPYAGLPMPVQPSDPNALPFDEPPLVEDEDGIDA